MNDLKNPPLLEPMLLFSQIVSAQLCHDMASPIGALFAGAEMLLPAATPEDQEIIDLLQNSSRVLKNRLDMFRAAFASGGQTLGSKQAKTLISEYFFLHEKMKLILDWPLDPITLPKGAFQLLINILLWMTPKAPKGGEMKVVITPSPPKIDIRLTSPMIFMRPDDEDTLTGKIPLASLHPQTVQPYLIYLLSVILNYSLEIKKLSFDELSLCLHLEGS